MVAGVPSVRQHPPLTCHSYSRCSWISVLPILSSSLPPSTNQPPTASTRTVDIPPWW